MFIDDIKEDSQVSVHASNKENKCLDFVSYVINVMAPEDIVLLNNIRSKFDQYGYKICIVKAFTDYESVLNFIEKIDKNGNKVTSSDIHCDVTISVNNSPHLFKDVKILRLRFPVYGTAHMIVCSDEAEEVNRRSEYRLRLGLDGDARVGDTRRIRKVIVRDISISGAGILVATDCNANIDDPVILEFYDYATSEPNKLKAPTLYKIQGNVVRVVEMGNNRKLLGLKTDDAVHDAVSRFINKKQIEKARYRKDKK